MGLLDGKVAIVTGAGSGIGRSSARLLASEGAKVVAADLNEAGGAATVASIVSAGGEAIMVVGDTSINKDVQEIVGTALSVFGGIQVLHNNAGILRTFSNPVEHSEEDWRRTLDVNLTGVFLMARAVIPVMRVAGGGSIINMASMAAVHAYAHGLAYAASKSGVRNFSVSLAEAVVGDNISVNAVCPGGVDTPILNWGMSRNTEAGISTELMQPEDIGRLVLYLAAHPGVSGKVIAARKFGGTTRYHYIDVIVSDHELHIGV